MWNMNLVISENELPNRPIKLGQMGIVNSTYHERRLDHASDRTEDVLGAGASLNLLLILPSTPRSRGHAKRRCRVRMAVLWHDSCLQVCGMFRFSHRSAWLGAVLAACLLLLLGCGGLGSTKIGDIMKDPRQFDGREVTVSGRVADSVNILILKYFVISDDTGEIIVVTERPVPQTGQQLKVKGRVNQAFSIAGKSLVVILEEKR